MKLKKFAGVLGLLLVLYFVIQQPSSAAGSVESILGFFGDAAESVTTFFTEVVN